MAETTPDKIPYVSSTERGNAADVPVLSETQALKIQAALVARATAADANISESIPVGTIVAYGGKIVPTGWHPCDGTTHGSARLATVLTGAQANPTLSPNLIDRFIVATAPTGSSNPGAYFVGSVGGVNNVTLTDLQSGLRAHDHYGWTGDGNVDHTHHGWTGGMNANNPHQHTAAWGEGVGGDAGHDGHFLDSVAESANSQKWWLSVSATDINHAHEFYSEGISQNHSHAVGIASSAALNATANHENRPPYYALIYIIRKGPNGT